MQTPHFKAIRVGTIPPPTPNPTSAQNIIVVDVATATNKIEIVAVSTFNINNRLIGAYACAPDYDWRKKIITLDAFFSDQDTRGKLERMVKKLDSFGQIARELQATPEMPDYSEELFRSVVDWSTLKPREKVRCIVVFVDKGMETPAEFSTEPRLVEAEMETSLDGFKKLVLGLPAVARPKVDKAKGGTPRSAKKSKGTTPFSGLEAVLGMEGKDWEMEINVLPQGTGATLYRWTGGKSVLGRWLDKGVWATQKEVYVEVHIRLASDPPPKATEPNKENGKKPTEKPSLETSKIPAKDTEEEEPANPNRDSEPPENTGGTGKENMTPITRPELRREPQPAAEDAAAAAEQARQAAMQAAMQAALDEMAEEDRAERTGKRRSEEVGDPSDGTPKKRKPRMKPLKKPVKPDSNDDDDTWDNIVVNISKSR